MKRYKLLKDLPGVKAGTTLRTGEQLYNELYNDDDGRPTGYRLIPNGDISGENPLLHSPASDWLEEVPEYKRWRADEGGEYWHIGSCGVVIGDHDDRMSADNMLYELGNYYKTKEETQKAAEWLKAFTTLRDDTKGFKPNWDDPEQDKWFVAYDHASRRLWVTSDFITQDKNLYFASGDDANGSIKKHEHEWLTYLNVEVKNDG